MAQQTLKKLKYNNSEVAVEVANRDGSGNVITSTYATKTELNTGLGGKQNTLTEGDGIDISNNTVSIEKTSSSNLGGMITGTGLEAASDGTVSLKIAGANQLGGVKIGSNISIDSSTGAISCTSLTWDNVSSKPFNTVDSGSGKHFTITSNKLYVNTDVFPTKQFVADTYVSLETWNTLMTGFKTRNIPSTPTANRVLLSISTEGTAVWSNWSTAGLLKTNTSGQVTIDTNAYITKTVSNLDNYYTKTEISNIVAGIKQFSYEVVTNLPQTPSEDTMFKIYLKAASPFTSDSDVYEEYITIKTDNGASANPRYTYSFEKIGDTDMTFENVWMKVDNPNGNKIITSGTGTTSYPNRCGESEYEIVNTKSSYLSLSATYKQKAVITGSVIESLIPITATDVTLDY